jgi:hypothetical protein
VNVNAWRAESVSADWFARASRAKGLSCIGQEKIAWEYGKFLMDAVTVLTPQGSRWERPMAVVENPGFFDEARAIARYFPIYSRTGEGDGRAG